VSKSDFRGLNPCRKFMTFQFYDFRVAWHSNPQFCHIATSSTTHHCPLPHLYDSLNPLPQALNVKITTFPKRLTTLIIFYASLLRKLKILIFSVVDFESRIATKLWTSGSVASNSDRYTTEAVYFLLHIKHKLSSYLTGNAIHLRSVGRNSGY
jgi:hypothetical protein